MNIMRKGGKGGISSLINSIKNVLNLCMIVWCYIKNADIDEIIRKWRKARLAYILLV
jgi:hypothetical protein